MVGLFTFCPKFLLLVESVRPWPPWLSSLACGIMQERFKHCAFDIVRSTLFKFAIFSSRYTIAYLNNKQQQNSRVHVKNVISNFFWSYTKKLQTKITFPHYRDEINEISFPPGKRYEIVFCLTRGQNRKFQRNGYLWPERSEPFFLFNKVTVAGEIFFLPMGTK